MTRARLVPIGGFLGAGKTTTFVRAAQTLQARGEVVGKRALMARVWSDRVVDENNLQSQIAALRTAFGAERDLIRTVSGRGYQFTGGVPLYILGSVVTSSVILELGPIMTAIVLIGRVGARITAEEVSSYVQRRRGRA